MIYKIITLKNQESFMKYHPLLVLLCLSIFPYPHDNLKAAQFPLAASYSIDNSWPTGYQVTWNTVANATSYTLQQSSSNTFSNPQTIFNGLATSTLVSVQVAGTYYYRVSATVGNTTSPYSNIVSTTVAQQTPPPTSNFLI